MTRDECEQAVCARIGEAQSVPFKEMRIGEWEPKVAACHQNVDFWVSHHPEHAAARGWLVVSCSGTTALLAAHSVVRGDDEILFDITPTQDSQYHRNFIRHIGDDRSFFEIEEKAKTINCWGNCRFHEIDLEHVLAASCPADEGGTL